MIATKKDIEALTGRKWKSCQIEWLRENAYPFEIGADGRPKVLVSVIEDRLGGSKSTRRELNWDNEAA